MFTKYYKNVVYNYFVIVSSLYNRNAREIYKILSVHKSDNRFFSFIIIIIVYMTFKPTLNIHELIQMHPGTSVNFRGEHWT